MLELSDLLAVGAAFLLTATVLELWRTSGGLSEFFSMRLRLVNVLLLACLLVVWHVCFQAAGAYARDRSLLGSRRLVDATRGTLLVVLSLAGIALVFDIELVRPAFLVLFAGLATTLVCGLRIAVQVGQEWVGGAALQQRLALIAGSGRRAQRLAQELEEDRDTGVRVLGFVDEEWSGAASLTDAGPHCICHLKDLGGFLRHQVVDELMVALPLDVLERWRRELIETCREYGVTVRFPMSVLVDVEPNPLPWRPRRDEIIMSLYHGVVGGWPLCMKRCLDLILGAPLLVAASPLLALAAIGIKITSPGPVFFTQERIGLNKRRFRLYKLRTMVADAESRLAQLEHLNETGGATFKIKHDPRITRFGHFLRQTSLDELPQLLNVLRGEMSLVGPRPLPLRDVERFDRDRDRRRFSVLPGMTGLWQVSGRSSLPFDRWIQLDLQYIDEWSVRLDLWILMRTIPAVLSRVGAT